MSLKAKLEAVIYAAEEPVTLAQLTALFAADALEWKSEQDASARAEAAEVDAVTQVEPNLPLLQEGFEHRQTDTHSSTKKGRQSRNLISS